MEKQKRSKLNDQFDHLCRMLQMGKTTRVEKLAVLNQTIRVVCQLKAENARLKEQRAQMKELLSQRQNGGSVEESLAKCASAKSDSPLDQTEAQVLALELQESQAAMVPQEVWAKNGTPYLKQDMMWMPSVNHEMIKQRVEEGVLQWSQFAPRQNDLDFAFGEESLVWLAATQQLGQAVPFEHFAECDFKRCLLPKPEVVDSVEMFLSSSDDPSDLLC